jgi:hypothetical protein
LRVDDRLTCATETPKRAGAMSFRIRRPPRRADPTRHREHADALEERKLERELREAADEDRPRERDDRLLEVGAAQSAKAMNERLEDRA